MNNQPMQFMQMQPMKSSGMGDMSKMLVQAALSRSKGGAPGGGGSPFAGPEGQTGVVGPMPQMAQPAGGMNPLSMGMLGKMMGMGGGGMGLMDILKGGMGGAAAPAMPTEQPVVPLDGHTGVW